MRADINLSSVFTLSSLLLKIQILREKGERGLHVEAPIPRLAPALDIALSRPSDPARSELGGLTKLAHQLFMERATVGC